MIKEIGKNEIKHALDLVNRVFSEFVAVDYSEQGNTTFNEYLKVKLEEVTNDVQTGHKRIWGYYIDDEVAGVIATRDVSHIALMFVDKQHHRKGIARQLYDTVLSEIRGSAGATQVTVNSSPYAVSVYERLGFVKTDAQQEKDGIIYVPMTHLIDLVDNPIPLGIYRHYKGNQYEAIGLAKHSETMEDMVIYRALYGERRIWVRPLSMWNNPIEVDGKTVKRFEYAGDIDLSDRRSKLSEAHRALASTLVKCESIDIGKLGKSQQTLLEKRIAALKIALSLIAKELEADNQRRL